MQLFGLPTPQSNRPLARTRSHLPSPTPSVRAASAEDDVVMGDVEADNRAASTPAAGAGSLQQGLDEAREQVKLGCFLRCIR